jgi:hypothetical protein
MDAYSFGMLCLWVISNETFSESTLKATDSSEVKVNSMDSWEEYPKQISLQELEYGYREELPALAYHIVTVMPGINEEQKNKLKQLFSMTLVHSSETRSSNFQELIKLLCGDR